MCFNVVAVPRKLWSESSEGKHVQCHRNSAVRPIRPCELGITRKVSRVYEGCCTRLPRWAYAGLQHRNDIYSVHPGSPVISYLSFRARARVRSCVCVHAWASECAYVCLHLRLYLFFFLVPALVLVLVYVYVFLFQLVSHLPVVVNVSTCEWRILRL